jgi:hypothetical protein
MASYQHQAAAGQTLAEVVGLPTNRSRRASTKRFRDEEWERRIEKDWQGNLETLRQCISEFLIGNQHPRMELMKADKRRQE